MKERATIASAVKEIGVGRFLAAFACLFLLGGQAAVFAQSPPPGRGSETDDDTDGATGDETVGTLPSLAGDDVPPPSGPIVGPASLDLGQMSRDGALILRGPLAEVVEVLAHSRSNGFIAVHVDSQGQAQAFVLGDYQLRIRPEALADAGLTATITSEFGIAARVVWNRRANDVVLGGGETLALPLGGTAATVALSRSPLAIEAVNAWGNTTRLDMGLEGGFITLSQARR